MTEQQIEELILKVNKAFNVDLKQKSLKRLPFYFRCIIVAKTNLHDTITAEIFQRDRATIHYYKQQYPYLKQYLDFKDLIKQVNKL
jgi:hypothetical protein